MRKIKISLPSKLIFLMYTLKGHFASKGFHVMITDEDKGEFQVSREEPFKLGDLFSPEGIEKIKNGGKIEVIE